MRVKRIVGLRWCRLDSNGSKTRYHMTKSNHAYNNVKWNEIFIEKNIYSYWQLIYLYTNISKCSLNQALVLRADWLIIVHLGI